MPAQHTMPRTLSKGAATRLATLSSNERAGWLCQSQGGEAPAVLVTGWSGLVRQLAIECVDLAASPPALAKAQSWLTGNQGSWHVGKNGSASWRILLPDGAWAATLMTNGLTIAKARKILSQ